MPPWDADPHIAEQRRLAAQLLWAALRDPRHRQFAELAGKLLDCLCGGQLRVIADCLLATQASSTSGNGSDTPVQCQGDP